METLTTGKIMGMKRNYLYILLILAIVRDLKNLISILHRDNDIYMSTSQLKEQEILRLKQTISLV